MREILDSKYRVLLTEVLPYERPLRIDGDAFCFNMEEGSLREKLENVFQEAGLKPKSWTIPFNYKIRRVGGLKSRNLSIPHPLIQLRWSDFYHEYDEYLIYLCSKSPFSLRGISKKTICKLSSSEADELEEDLRVDIDNPLEVDKKYRSYFNYKKYDMMYKFFDSGDYLRLEQKFPLMMCLDVSNCFYSIYTHGVSWAIKGKEVAKELKGNEGTFESKIDKLMQHSNYNETNGIIVGPEFSRIFAEIILQRIDLNVMSVLKQKKLKLGHDYEIRRYVDDYFIYSYSRANLALIKEVLREELEFYKLHINEAKETVFERPFISSLNAAKQEVSIFVKQVYNHYKDKSINEYVILQNVAKKFRVVVSRNNQLYGNLNRFFLSALIRQIKQAMKEKDVTVEDVEIKSLSFLEVAYYIFSLDMSHSASLKLCRIIELLYKWTKGESEVYKNRILRETKRVVDIYVNMRICDEVNIEIINILMAVKTLYGEQDFFSYDLLRVVYGDNDKWNYFHISTLLFLIGKRTDCQSFCKDIEQRIEQKMETGGVYKTENVYLWLDILTCPYLEPGFKDAITMKLFNSTKEKAQKINRKLGSVKTWFFNWSDHVQLTSLLEKREYSVPYE